MQRLGVHKRKTKTHSFISIFLLIVVVSSVVHSCDEDLFSHTYTAQQHYISLQATLQFTTCTAYIVTYQITDSVRADKFVWANDPG